MISTVVSAWQENLGVSTVILGITLVVSAPNPRHFGLLNALLWPGWSDRVQCDAVLLMWLLHPGPGCESVMPDIPLPPSH